MMSDKTEKPNSTGQVWTESLHSEITVVEGGEDTTRRPRRPNVPLTPPVRPRPATQTQPPNEGKNG